MRQRLNQNTINNVIKLKNAAIDWFNIIFLSEASECLSFAVSWPDAESAYDDEAIWSGSPGVLFAHPEQPLTK